MLVWSILGISAIIPPPLIKLCNKFNQNISPGDMADVINGLFKDMQVSGPTQSYTGDGSSYDFIYQVTLPDGSVQRNLNAEQLQQFMAQNQGISFDFSNFQTIQ